MISANPRFLLLSLGQPGSDRASPRFGADRSAISGRSTSFTDAELNHLVRELVRTVPDSAVAEDYCRMPSLAQHSQLRLAKAGHPASGFGAVPVPEELEIHPGELDLEPAISAITERAQHPTGATGRAIALRIGDEIVGRARAPLLILASVSRWMRVSLETPSAPARSCCATMPSAIQESIWPVAVGWDSGSI